jgi:hypothetical protein
MSVVVKWYIVKVFIVECNLSIKLKKIADFQTYVCTNYVLCFDGKNPQLKFVHLVQIHPVCVLLRGNRL